MIGRKIELKWTNHRFVWFTKMTMKKQNNVFSAQTYEGWFGWFESDTMNGIKIKTIQKMKWKSSN